MWQVFNAKSGNELWEQTFRALKQRPASTAQDSRVGPMREILHAALSLTHPQRRWITVRQPALNIAFALAEVIWIVTGRQDGSILKYFNKALGRHVGEDMNLHGAYGFRLRKHFQVDQLENAYHALKNNPNTRQVVMQIWDVQSDLPTITGEPRNRDIPCNTQSLLKIRDGKLEWVQIMRSNDIFLGLPYNLIQFTFLHEIMAGWLDLDLGTYHHISDSLHLYERDLSQVTADGPQAIAYHEDFRLGKVSSDRVMETLSQAMDIIAAPQSMDHDILAIIDDRELPVSYHNILRTLAAEGLRRRSRPDLSHSVMSKCTSVALKQMWDLWSARVQSV